MPARERNHELIWSLIISLVIHLIFAITVMTGREVERAAPSPPLVLWLTPPYRAPASPPPSRLRPLAAVKIKREIHPPAPLYSPESPPTLPATKEITTVTTPQIPAAILPEAEHTESTVLSKNEEPPPEPSNEELFSQDKMINFNYTPPVLLDGIKPPYPKRAEENGWEGTVLLNVKINSHGGVDHVEIAKSSGYEILDRQANESLKRWRFTPAHRNGVAVDVTVQQPIIFRHILPRNKQ